MESGKDMADLTKTEATRSGGPVGIFRHSSSWLTKSISRSMSLP